MKHIIQDKDITEFAKKAKKAETEEAIEALLIEFIEEQFQFRVEE